MHDHSKKEYFQEHADCWDRISVHDLDKVEYITGVMGLKGGEDILDVGTGTGVMIPFYEEHGAGHVKAIDFSENMIDVARGKYPKGEHPGVDLVVQDLYTLEESEVYDCVVCYSCFPHFPDQRKALSIFNRTLKNGGTMVLAHSCSKDHINAVHKNGGEEICDDVLPELPIMEGMFEDAGFQVTFTKDDDDYYVVIGTKMSQ